MASARRPPPPLRNQGRRLEAPPAPSVCSTARPPLAPLVQGTDVGIEQYDRRRRVFDYEARVGVSANRGKKPRTVMNVLEEHRAVRVRPFAVLPCKRRPRREDTLLD